MVADRPSSGQVIVETIIDEQGNVTSAEVEAHLRPGGAAGAARRDAADDPAVRQDPQHPGARGGWAAAVRRPEASEDAAGLASFTYWQEQVPAQGLLFWQEKLIWLLPQ